MRNNHPKTILLQNARAIFRDQITECAIQIENGRIKHILESQPDEAVKSDELINVAELIIFPGFIDAHIHGAVGVDTNEADADSLHRAARFLAKNGVTAWMPTLVPDSEENYRRAIEAVDELIRTQEDREPAARVLGVAFGRPDSANPNYLTGFRATHVLDYSGPCGGGQCH